MSKIIYIIFITILKIIHTGPMDEPPLSSKEDYPNIKCGKKNPKKPSDCTKYGTDSKMLCCWVTSGEHETNNAECILLSYSMANLKVYRERKSILEIMPKDIGIVGIILSI